LKKIACRVVNGWEFLFILPVSVFREKKMKTGQ